MLARTHGRSQREHEIMLPVLNHCDIALKVECQSAGSTQGMTSRGVAAYYRLDDPRVRTELQVQMPLLADVNSTGAEAVGTQLSVAHKDRKLCQP